MTLDVKEAGVALHVKEAGVALHADPALRTGTLLPDPGRPLLDEPTGRERLTPRAIPWRRAARRYIALLVVLDFLMTLTVVGAMASRRYDVGEALALGLLAAASFVMAITLCGGYRRRGTGLSMHKLSSLLHVTGLLAVVALALQGLGVLHLPHTIVFQTLLLTIALAALVRLMQRAVARRRLQGPDRSRLLVFGSLRAAQSTIERLLREPGVEVVGAVVVGQSGPQVAGVQVVDPNLSVRDAVDIYEADTVLVTGADAHTGDSLRELAWSLEGTGVDVAFAVGLPDVAQSRLTVHGGGLTRVHLKVPSFAGVKYTVKSAIDRAGAALFLLALSPLMIATAAAVKLTSRGPVLYRQERIGRDGVPFSIFKFRSMANGSDKQLEQVMGDDIQPFYKRPDDPRITPVGKIIRRLSIDELPQLLNVLRGEMSLVGPRPQIDKEVATYDDVAYRRLRVKPGLTGLWQVSGRSSLPPEEGIRLDVSYADNWTPLGDLAILAKTARAVVSSEGAY